MRRLAFVVLLLALSGCDEHVHCPADTEQRAVPDAPADAAWDPSLEWITSYEYGEPWLATFFVYGVNLALPGAFGLWMLASWFTLARKRRRARRSAREATTSSLREGDALLHGVVMESDEPGPVVRLDIEQVGVEYTKDKSKGTRWTEVDRKLMTKPFRVKTEAGVIDVAIDDELMLIDDLETSPRKSATRFRFAEVMPGDEVYLEGRLEQVSTAAGGYRGGGKGWKLRAPDDGRMMLSTHPLDAGYALQARERRLAFVLIAILMVISQLSILPYHLAVASAVDEPAQVTHRCDFPGGDDEHVYVMGYRLLSTGEARETRVNAETHGAVKVGTIIPVNVLRNGDLRVTLGKGPSPYGGPVLAFMLITFVAVFGLRSMVSRSKLWWERDQLVDDASGSLEDQP